MFFIFGIGKSTLPNKHLLEGCICSNCNQQNKIYTVTKANYFHFFFVPVFPLTKSTIAFCSNCKTVFKRRDFSEQMNFLFQKQNELKPNKRPIWHGCGCMIIILFILFITGIILFRSPSSTSNVGDDPRKEMLKNDLSKLTLNPTMTTDSTAFKLKNCLNEFLVEEIHPEKIKLFTKQQDQKLLILLKVDNMKKVDPSERKEFINIIKDCLSLDYNYDDKELYIGVSGRWNMVLTSTPDKTDLGGRFASESILFDFYDKDEETIVIDTIIIRNNTKK